MAQIAISEFLDEASVQQLRAALDLPEAEPLPAGSLLADVTNPILTPHIAGVAAESHVRVSALIAGRVLATLAQRGA